MSKNKFTDYQEFKNFEEMGLSDSILRGVFSYGFEKPSTIQARAIVPIMSGKDVIVQSQSGTGKTGTFVISSLQQIDQRKNGCQIMIMAHTKELARQICTVCSNIGKYVKANYVLCTGGVNIHDSKKYITSRASIVVGTPGRIIDMLERRFLSLDNLKIFILDEADEMLSPGFQNQIKSIIQEAPKTSQMCIFSATLPRSTVELTRHFMKEPLQIRVKHEELTLEGIRQFYINVQRENYKFDTFCDIYSSISVCQSIVYVNKKRKADWLKERLEGLNFTISVMHSNLRADQREEIMRDYRHGKTRILISTDLLARGIDIQQVSVVINYDLPNNKESYLHRIGRSGRFGRKGMAINFVTQNDAWKLEELERFYETKIEEMPSNFDELI